MIHRGHKLTTLPFSTSLSVSLSADQRRKRKKKRQSKHRKTKVGRGGGKPNDRYTARVLPVLLMPHQLGCTATESLELKHVCVEVNRVRPAGVQTTRALMGPDGSW